MKKTLPQKYLSRLKKAYRLADSICKKHRNIDRETVVQTYLALQKTPLERLNFSLMRAQKLNVN